MKESSKKAPWEEHKHIWKTESAFLSYVRGGIRRSLWNKSPIKLEFLKANRKRIINPVAKNRTRFPEVWGGTCYQCSKDFALKDMEVDHITGEHSLRKLEDLQSFVEGIVCVSNKDLGLICKPCHKAKTYAERSGMSIVDALIEKEAIAICKLPVAAVREWIVSNGKGCDFPAKTAKGRREQIVNILKEKI